MTQAATIASNYDWPHFDRLAREASGGQALPATQFDKPTTSLAFIENQIAHPDQFPLLSGEWSDFAARTLDDALQMAWRAPRIAKHTRDMPETGTVPGLFVLGLGKLGGRDLNYSSDVDLVAFFDAQTLPVPPNEGRTYVCDMALKAMTKAIAGRTDADRVWRVDWRLRPDPSVTGLSMSTEAALEFFAFRSAPWRRLAMMKARVVAGDTQAGERFLQRLGAFIWRQTLDFRTLDEIAAVKDRIKNEHPGLAATGPAATDVEIADDFHIKLGSGGIREAEFIVNARQLIWGGRQAELRTTNTLEAMQAAAELGHIEERDAKDLRAAYIWLRRLENAVQMIGDRQTHVLPTDPNDRELITAIMRMGDWSALVSELTAHRRNVARCFDMFLQDDADISTASDRSVPGNISAASEAIVETWQAGFLAHGATPDQHIAPLAATLLHVAAQMRDPDDAIARMDDFLRTLPKGGQYLRLLASHEAIAERVFGAFLASAPVASLLRQSPHIIDVLLERGGSTQLNLAATDTLLARAKALPYEESRLEWVRSWTNERLFLAYLGALQGERDEAQIAREITLIAERALDVCAGLTAYHLDASDVPVSIVGFGRLGMENMHPLSDLDLLFLANDDDPTSLDRANRFSLRLKSTLDIQMRAGRVWEIDMRLRPSGRSGPPTLRPASFRTHQLERAKTWEHIALVPARFICGTDASRTQFDATRLTALTTPRDGEALLADAASMLALLRAERTGKANPDAYEVKLVPGGLMEAEFLLHTLVLLHGAEHPSLADTPYSALPAMLADIDPDLATLRAALTNLTDMQFTSRLFGAASLPERFEAKEWRKRREKSAKSIRAILEAKLPALLASDMPDAPVKWSCSPPLENS